MGRKVCTCISMFLLLAVFCASVGISTADTFRPVVRGRRGVVAGGQPLSVEAGMRVLQRGGNAVDAGVATILAASVIEFSHFSFGGEVPTLIKLKGKDVSVIEGMGTAPAKATREFFVNRAKETGSGTTATAPDSAATQRANKYKDMASMPGAKPGLIPSTGPLSATVPAVLDACIVALDRFGTKSLAEVMQPAIDLADGFPIDELRVNYITTRAPIFSQWPDAKRIFLPNGQAPKVGDVLNVEARISADTIQQLKSRGHKIKLQTDWGTGSSPTVITYDQKSGVISGGADPRRGRYAVAW